MLSLFKEGNGLPLLLNGLPKRTHDKDADENDEDDEESESDSDDSDDSDDDSWTQTPNADRIAAISPLAQVRRGTYKVPTFVIHGTNDEIVPYSSAVVFVDALHAAGVEAQLLTVQGARHIHDVSLKPGSTRWDETVLPGYEFLFRHLALRSAVRASP